ncbi:MULTISPECIES: hypothetical protein [unclassified Corynebacterium]|uniref:hypothetical protein n=1 Tax=unclassified Corynebacterium TaxID=2624378 RepID=UPI0029CA25FB|nr:MULTISPECIES: hypothetical protein [unclassified Corynebacterium]WPF65973.1 hypothetical protein OLX12_10525 [Corynebacterium sp. 22KM0430]WPF68466.1 hypothetical protein OLW90_10520 [Corynebacterium sp. 21KM1197]
MSKALESYLGEIEYVYGARAEYEAIKRGEVATVSLDELLGERGSNEGEGVED